MSYQKLRKLYETGATIQEIANYFEVGSQYIYIRLKRSGATMRPSGLRCTPEAKQALKVKIAPLRTQGLSKYQIAEIVEVSRLTVPRYLKFSSEKLLE